MICVRIYVVKGESTDETVENDTASVWFSDLFSAFLLWGSHPGYGGFIRRKNPGVPGFYAETSGSESELSAASKEVTSPDPSASSLPSSSFSSPSGSPSGTTEPTEPAVEKFTLGFTGDVCFAENYKIYQLAKKNNRELLNCFSPTLLEQLQAVDFLTVNCESSVSNRGAALAGKGYTFRTSVATAKVFKEMGADLIGLANNHVYDFGKDAFLDTLDAFSEMNLPTVGAGRNAEEAYAPYILEKNGIKVAFVATSRAEKQYFTPVAEGENPGISGCYVLTRACSAIEVAKAQADFVIVYAHFGYEYNTVIEPAQQRRPMPLLWPERSWWWGRTPIFSRGSRHIREKWFSTALEIFSSMIRIWIRCSSR